MSENTGTALLVPVSSERRINAFKPELRTASDGTGPKHIYGYASMFNKLSRKLGGGFVERVDNRAFEVSKAGGFEGVVCRWNHKDDFLLGTTAARTCLVNTDSVGLLYDVTPPSFRSDLIELMERGDVGGSSFAFRCSEGGGDDWALSDFGMPLRTLLEVELIDVAPVTTPAYPDAMSAVRSLDGAVESLARKFDADPAEIRSLLDNNQGVKLFKSTYRPTEVRENKEETMESEDRSKLTSKERNALPKSSFAYVDEDGVGHFPIHDAAHVRNALARIAQGAKYGQQALPKVKAAAKKFGIDSDEQNNLGQLGAELREVELPEWFTTTEAEEERADSDSSDSKASSKSTSDEDDDENDDDDDSGKGTEAEGRSAEDRAAKASYDDLETCGNCGSTGQYGKHCTDCGNSMEPPMNTAGKGKFCPNCGSKMKGQRSEHQCDTEERTEEPETETAESYEADVQRRRFELLGKRYDPYVDQD